MAIRRAYFPLPDLTAQSTAGFFEHAAHGELRIPRCARCGSFAWYPTDVCRHCGGDDLPWAPTSGAGTLFSWAVVRRAFLPAFAEMLPFATALVALDDDPAVRIVTLVVDTDPASLVAGQAMEVTFRPLRFPTVPDREVVVPMFRPAG